MFTMCNNLKGMRALGQRLILKRLVNVNFSNLANNLAKMARWNARQVLNVELEKGASPV